MIIASDIHLREESAETVFGQVLPGLHDAAVAGGHSIALLGDIYHLRYRVDVRLQNALADELRRWSRSGIVTQIIPGNHDQIDVQGRNALEVLGEIANVYVYTDPVVTGDGLWLPYRKREEDLREALRAPHLRFAGKVRVAFMHHGIVGAMMNDAFVSTEGLEASEFQNFDVVFCGHFHKRQRIGNVVYVGSPYQTKADEAGHAKGYVVWDGQQYEYVDTQWGKRYHTISLERGDSLDLSGVGANDEVRVRTGSGVDPEKVGKQLAKAGISAHSVTPEVEPLQTRLDVPENADLSRFALAYVNAVDTHLDRDRLMHVFTELSNA